MHYKTKYKSITFAFYARNPARALSPTFLSARLLPRLLACFAWPTIPWGKRTPLAVYRGIERKTRVSRRLTLAATRLARENASRSMYSRFASQPGSSTARWSWQFCENKRLFGFKFCVPGHTLHVTTCQGPNFALRFYFILLTTIYLC